MDIGSIAALVVSTIGIIWGMFRDKSADTNELLERMSEVETKVALQEQRIDSLSSDVDDMEKTLKNLEDQMHQLDLKIERILTILEKNKGG